MGETGKKTIPDRKQGASCGGSSMPGKEIRSYFVTDAVKQFYVENDIMRFYYYLLLFLNLEIFFS